MRFNDTTTGASRRAQDKAEPMRHILEKFTKNCLLPYPMGQDDVIDEMMKTYPGNCPLMYIYKKF